LSLLALLITSFEDPCRCWLLGTVVKEWFAIDLIEGGSQVRTL
jgi:hypothetical protein